MGYAAKFKLVEKHKHLWMPMIKRLQYRDRKGRMWIQAFEMAGCLCLSSHSKTDFKTAKDYLLKMGIIHRKPID